MMMRQRAQSSSRSRVRRNLSRSIMSDDLKALSESAHNKDSYQQREVNASLLERFDAPGLTGRDAQASNALLWERIEAPEFTCLCPITGQPDFATIEILYEPNEHCVESKSLKLYLGSFRNVGTFHEAVVARIADDLNTLLDFILARTSGASRRNCCIDCSHNQGGNMKAIELGATYTDRITGFKGMATGYVQYMTGCNQVLLAPKVTGEGAMRDAGWFDEQRLTRDEGVDVLVLDNSETPGFDKPAPIK